MLIHPHIQLYVIVLSVLASCQALMALTAAYSVMVEEASKKDKMSIKRILSQLSLFDYLSIIISLPLLIIFVIISLVMSIILPEKIDE